VRPESNGALLALPSTAYLSEVEEPATSVAALPAGAAGAVACESPRALFRALRRVRLLLAQSPPLPEKKLEQKLAAITTTEAQAVVRRRVGQELFREALLEYWDGRCAVTGLDISELLRASHAKPWKDATDAERLDVHNGLLLTVHLDARFDPGLLTFVDNGQALLSADLPQGALVALGLERGVPPLRQVVFEAWDRLLGSGAVGHVGGTGMPVAATTERPSPLLLERVGASVTHARSRYGTSKSSVVPTRSQGALPRAGD
jgi:hypothetical protein